MARFRDLGITAELIVGKRIGIDDLFGKRILIEKTIIAPTKYPGKNSSGMRMQMQVVLAEFNEGADAKGDYYRKGEDGNALGERRSCFTGSDILIDSIRKAEEKMGSAVYPIDTAITRVGKAFYLT